jgi:ribosome-associated protein
LTDFYVITSATSTPHLQALSASIEREVKTKAQVSARVSGDAESAWIVVDFGDVIAHIFLPEAREYYDIEELWRNPPVEK